MKSKTRISKFFETLIYFILLTIPMISVFARTIYVQANPNAKDSYEVGRSIDYVTTFDDFNLTDTFYFSSINNVGASSNDNSKYIGITNLNIIYNGMDTVVIDESIVVGFRLTNYDNLYLVFIKNDGTNYQGIRYSTFNLAFSFNYVGNTYSSNQLFSTYFGNGLIYRVDSITYLSDAFDYGLKKTIDDFGTGNINFLNWFGTMFSNNTNLLYINFVNMYLNYALWVSVGYLLYYFLNWFIRFVRETLDNLIYKETKN